MYAYDDTLIYKARLCMAWMLDYAVYVLNMPIEDFYQLFQIGRASCRERV